MMRKAYLRTILLWALLVLVLTLLSRPFGNIYREPMVRIGETVGQFTAPRGVQVLVKTEARDLVIVAARGVTALEKVTNLELIDVSASLFLATVILTPVGSARRRMLWTASAFIGFVVGMGIVVAGLALVPLVQGGFLNNRIAWRLAALFHNAATSGLIISLPAAIWFFSTIAWWRKGFRAAPETPSAGKPAEGKLTRRERRKREREERKKKR